MPVSQEFLTYVIEQMGNQKEISYKRMFGECAIYYNKKIVALVCNNKLFLKPTEKGKSFIKDVVEAPPYQGAKNYFLIEDQIEDKNWLQELIRLTESELPEPKEKKPKRKNDSINP